MDGDTVDWGCSNVLIGEGFDLEGETEGSIDILSISPLNRSRSRSACPPALLALSCSI